MPIWPLLLALDPRHARPTKPFAANANAIAYGTSTALYKIKEMVGWVDDDGTGPLSCVVLNHFASVNWIEVSRLRLAGTSGKSKNSPHRVGCHHQLASS